MSLQSDTTPRCPMCASTELTPATAFLASEGGIVLKFRIRGAPAGLFAHNLEFFEADRARACLACGHLTLGFSPAKLGELRAKAAWLDPADRR